MTAPQSAARPRHGARPCEKALAPLFTWHGFQHIFVSAAGGATFDASVDALVARWTTADLESAATISFAADGGGAADGHRRRQFLRPSRRGDEAAASSEQCGAEQRRPRHRVAVTSLSV